jgi:hypothetical protein
MSALASRLGLVSRLDRWVVGGWVGSGGGGRGRLSGRHGVEAGECLAVGPAGFRRQASGCASGVFLLAGVPGGEGALVCGFSMTRTHLLRRAIIQPGGVGIVRFFRQADRPGESRLAAAVVAAVAVAAVVLAGDSALPRLSGMPIPAAVEDALTHPGSAGVVASGKIGNASWQLVFRPSAQIGGQPGLMCVYGLGQAFLPFTSIGCLPFPRTPLKSGARSDPVWFYPFAEDQLQGAVGVVGADVTSIVLGLDDGQQVKLVPVGRYGYRLVAFVIPGRAGIAAATAYLSNGQYATAIPSDNNGLLFFSSWLWHGAHGH